MGCFFAIAECSSFDLIRKCDQPKIFDFKFRYAVILKYHIYKRFVEGSMMQIINHSLHVNLCMKMRTK